MGSTAVRWQVSSDVHAYIGRLHDGAGLKWNLSDNDSGRNPLEAPLAGY